MSTTNLICYHGIPKPARIPALAIVFSITFHAALLWALDRPWEKPVKEPIAKAPPSDFVMVDLKDETEPQDLPKSLDDPPAAPVAPVPMQPDVPVDLRPTDIPQEIIPGPLNPRDIGDISKIPLNPGRTPTHSEIERVFNPIDLDKRPEPISRTSPTFPYELQRTVSEATVVVGFIITSRGEVVQPRIISSSHSGFERSALAAIEKWKFRPGMKNGKKVNTRAEQPLSFVLQEDR